ncbi:hypothetical protein P4S73_00885 [Paraglaciecola sp. Hal342]
MKSVVIFHCNKTYNEKWLRDKKHSNGIQYKIIESIIYLIEKNHGGAITQKEILEHHPDIKGILKDEFSE